MTLRPLNNAGTILAGSSVSRPCRGLEGSGATGDSLCATPTKARAQPEPGREHRLDLGQRALSKCMVATFPGLQDSFSVPGTNCQHFKNGQEGTILQEAP